MEADVVHVWYRWRGERGREGGGERERGVDMCVHACVLVSVCVCNFNNALNQPGHIEYLPQKS